MRQFCEFSQGVSPICQLPVPALSTFILRLYLSTISLAIAWANGERQIFPRQTKRILDISLFNTYI